MDYISVKQSAENGEYQKGTFKFYVEKVELREFLNWGTLGQFLKMLKSFLMQGKKIIHLYIEWDLYVCVILNMIILICFRKTINNS